MYPKFDLSRLKLRPLQERNHDMPVSEILPLACPHPLDNPDLGELKKRILAANEKGASVILLMGAHVIKTGMSRFIIDLMERGYISHIGFNGACVIHDYELALIGGTSESVPRYISEGQFGLWQETGQINTIVKEGVQQGLGFGEAVGKAIWEGDYPHKATSILAAGYRLRIPVTVHVSIGQDIIHEHPNFDGSSCGKASHTDFLILAESVRNLEGGVLLNIGTAVMGPEVYLKALSMARNVAHQEGKVIRNFTTSVFDMQPISSRDYHSEPTKDQPEYYHRFWKTILIRTVRDGGTSYYIEGDHRTTISSLWAELTSAPPEV